MVADQDAKGHHRKYGLELAREQERTNNLDFFTDVRVKSGSFKLVSHVQNFIKFLALKASQQTVVVVE